MYSLDINFLKDRPENQSQDSAPKAVRRKVPMGEKAPMYIGIGIGLLLPALAGGLLLFIQQQTSGVQAEQAKKQKEIDDIQSKIKQVEQIKGKIAEVKTQTSSVIGIFNQIKPWSAILQDLRDRTPPNLQIKIIQEALLPPTAATPSPTPKPASPSPTPAASASPGASPKAGSTPTPTPTPTPTLPPPPLTGINITGTAKSFDEVNIFLLSLKQSPFFRSADTRLQSAQRVPNPTQIEQVQTPGQAGAPVTYELPQIVTYTIQTRLSDTSAADLLAELERKGAVGLATRIRTIQKIQAQGATP